MISASTIDQKWVQERERIEEAYECLGRATDHFLASETAAMLQRHGTDPKGEFRAGMLRARAEREVQAAREMLGGGA